MASRDKQFYITSARELCDKLNTGISGVNIEVTDTHECVKDGPETPTITIPTPPTVSLGSNPGGWVMAWIFIPDNYNDAK